MALRADPDACETFHSFPNLHRRVRVGYIQADLLAEGKLPVQGNSIVAVLEQAFISAAEIPCGTPRQTRP